MPAYPFPAGISMQSHTSQGRGFKCKSWEKQKKFSVAPETADLRVMPYNGRVTNPIHPSHTSHRCLPTVPQWGDEAAGQWAMAHTCLSLSGGR